MHLIVSRQNLGRWAARFIQNRATAFAPRKNKPFVLGLPTGSTVLDLYACLCRDFQSAQLDVTCWMTFNMDEYVGLSPKDPQSYHYYMQKNLFDTLHFQPGHTHILNGQASDLLAECEQYELAIAQAGGIELFIGGVGRNGHLAFNEPGSSFTSRTRPISLTLSTRQANARFFGGDPSYVPSQALTVGIGTILAARELLFLASGPSKAMAVARLAQGEISIDWPITALKTHPHAILLVDEEAASQLTGPAAYQSQQARQQSPEADTWMVEL